MNNQELNEKIATWCGLEPYNGVSVHDGAYTEWVNKNNFNEVVSRTSKPPNFLDPERGMGLMGKYPIAKLREKYHGLQIRIAYMGSGGKIIIEQRKNCKDIVLVSKEFVDGYVSTTTALALALGELIEEENDKASMAKEDTETKT